LPGGNVSLSLLQKFVALEKTRNWTDEELRALSTKQCKQIGTWNAGVVQVDQDLKDRIQVGMKDPTAADKMAALKICAEQSWKKNFHIAIEESIVGSGGSLAYTPDSIVHTKLDNTQETFVNSPIPLARNQNETRPNVSHITAFCSQVVKQSGGKWIVQVAGLDTVFGKDGIDTVSAFGVATFIISLLENDAVWKAKSTVEKLSTTGIRALIFVRDMLL